MPKKNTLYTRPITERFLKEVDRIIGKGPDKQLNHYHFAQTVGVNPSNLSRMKTDTRNNVSIEACILLCIHYGTDPIWLFMGEDYEAKVDERIQTLDKMIAHMGKLINQQTERKQIRTRVKG